MNLIDKTPDKKEPNRDKKTHTSHNLQTNLFNACTEKVFPVPGGPTSKTPKQNTHSHLIQENIKKIAESSIIYLMSTLMEEFCLSMQLLEE